ncbi:MAG: tyrosine-type recombinase/integrase [Phycisphaerales bacterium]|jgi:integrase|nr:tyrosine-type recombinase/integrase [Phycisphaerales bacterium]
MKFADREVVDGTSISIGRKVQFRTDHAGARAQRTSRTYTAEYRDAEGLRRFAALGTTNKREARRLAIELQKRLDEGAKLRVPGRIGIVTLIGRYEAFSASKGLAPRTLAKYRADLAKLAMFCAEQGIATPSAFTEEAFQRYGAWLRERSHKQAAAYAPKSIHTALTVAKQLFKWAKRQRLIGEDPIEAAALPIGRPRPQRGFTTEEVEAMLSKCAGRPGWRSTHDAIAILAFTGLRVGELREMRWEDVKLDRGELGVLHVRRGGACDAPKDKDDRFVPIHPRIRPIIDALPRVSDRVLPDLRERTLLARVQRLARELGLGPGCKTHGLRHHFVSMCASSGVPTRLCLSWVGHSSSAILDLYYHLHDGESEAAMRRLSERTR